MDRWNEKFLEIQDAIWEGIDTPPRLEATTISRNASVEERIWAKIGSNDEVKIEATPPPIPKEEEDLPPVPVSLPVESTPPPIPGPEEEEEQSAPSSRKKLPITPADEQQQRPRPSSSFSIKTEEEEQSASSSRKKLPITPTDEQQQRSRPTPSIKTKTKTPPFQYRRQQQQAQSPAMRVSALQRALNDIHHSESHNVPNISIDRVRNEFMRYDKDRTGVVDTLVFQKVIRDRLGWKISDRSYKRLMSRLDPSRNRVDYTEFQAALAMSALALHRHKTPSPVRAATTPPYSSSSSKKKQLNPTQRITKLKRILREMLQAQHVRTTDVSMRQVRDAFVSMDGRKRGCITKPQFERALRFNLKWNNISSKTLESLYDLIENEDKEHVDYTIFQASFAMLTNTTNTTNTTKRPAVADLASASKAIKEQRRESDQQENPRLSGVIARTVATAIARAVSNADERAEESQRKLREEILRTAMKPPKEKNRQDRENVVEVKVNKQQEQRNREEEHVRTEGPSVRQLLEISQNEEDDEMFAALTTALRFGNIDPLCESHLKIKRQCNALQQENKLLRSVIENMKSSVSQFTSRLEHAVSPRMMTSTRRRSRPPPPAAPPRTAPRRENRRVIPHTAPPAKQQIESDTPTSFADLSRQRRGSMMRKNARWAKKLSRRLGPQRARTHQHVMNRFSRTSVKRNSSSGDNNDTQRRRPATTRKQYGFPSSF